MNRVAEAALVLILAAVLLLLSFVPMTSIQAQDLTESASPSIDKAGLYYTLISPTASNDGANLALGDKDSPIFTTEAILSKWNGEASLTVSMPPPDSKSFTWNTAVKLSAEITRKDGNLVVVPERIVYPYDDITDLVLYELPPDAQNEGGSFEYELKVYSLPKSNIFIFNIETHNLNFFYQPDMTTEELARGNWRPENAIGSYAVYHSANQGNQYKTGKAFHIYRPKVIDATGTWEWAVLNVDTKAGLMTVTVDQKFLDNAIYPVVIDPTFGYTSSGSGNGQLEDKISGGLYSSGGAGVVVSISAYFNSNGDNIRTAKVAVYTGDYYYVTSSSEEHTLPLSTSAQLDFTMTAGSITNTNYYLVAWADAGINSAYIKYDYTGGTSLTDSNTYGAWPNPINTPTIGEDRYSIWCNYVQTPTVTYDAASNIDKTSVTLNGDVTNAGDGTITIRGFNYDTDSGVPYTDNWHEHGSWGVAGFDSSGNITGLSAGTLYYFVAYATNEGGTGTSTEGSFTTLPDVPLVVEDDTSDVLTTTATLKGNITAVQGDNADTYGFEWDIDTGAPYASSWTSGAGSYGVGAYNRGVTALTPGVEYFFQFIATNSAGQGNSAEDKFLTHPVKPSSLVDGVKTDGAITYAWTNGSGAQKTMVRYSDTAYPTNITEGTQAYFDTLSTCDLTGLTPATKYYVSAWSYVTVDGLVQYSSDYAFDTAYTRPSDVPTLDAHNPTIDSIDLEWGNATGADKFMVRSSTAGYPTSPSDGAQVYFSTELTTTHSSLQPGRPYYYVVYAYDNEGGLYSTNAAQDTETTLIDAPIITNGLEATAIGDTYVTLNGEVTYTGGESPTCKFYWGDNDGGVDPGSWDNEENMGVRSSSFSKNLQGLTKGKTYYYRTYGSSSGGSDWADSTSQWTCGCLDPGNITVVRTGNEYALSWTANMAISTIKMGLDTPPDSPFDGTYVYRGNGTSTKFYLPSECLSGNLTFRLWHDCTACTTCTTFSFSELYSETSVILAGSCGEGGGLGDMLKSVYDTNDDGVVDAADFAALAGDADTLDTHHWIEIPVGGGNITFVTDSGNVTGNVINLFGSGSISTSGNSTTITISGTSFLTLSDTPDSYAGQAGKTVVVDITETGLEFADFPAGGNCTGNCTGSGDTFKYIALPGGTILTASGNDTLTLTGTDIQYTGNSGNQTIDVAIGGARVEHIADYLYLSIILAVALALTWFAYSKPSLPLRIIGFITCFSLMVPLKAYGPVFMVIGLLLGLAILFKAIVEVARAIQKGNSPEV